MNKLFGTISTELRGFVYCHILLVFFMLCDRASVM